MPAVEAPCPYPLCSVGRRQLRETPSLLPPSTTLRIPPRPALARPTHPRFKPRRKFRPPPQSTLDFDDRILQTTPDRTIRERIPQHPPMANIRRRPRCSDTAPLKPTTRAILLLLPIWAVIKAVHLLARHRDPAASQNRIPEHPDPWKWEGRRHKTSRTDAETSWADPNPRSIITKIGLVSDPIHSMIDTERNVTEWANSSAKKESALTLAATQVGITCLPTN